MSNTDPSLPWRRLPLLATVAFCLQATLPSQPLLFLLASTATDASPSPLLLPSLKTLLGIVVFYLQRCVVMLGGCSMHRSVLSCWVGVLCIGVFLFINNFEWIFVTKFKRLHLVLQFFLNYTCFLESCEVFVFFRALALGGVKTPQLLLYQLEP